MINRKITITGKVQGVFFRKFTLEKATLLGIKGWVKNESDGSVTVEVEGELHQLLAMTSWLKEGPPMAEVQDLMITHGEPQGYQDFQIIR
jgi:acylphosphatase